MPHLVLHSVLQQVIDEVASIVEELQSLLQRHEINRLSSKRSQRKLSFHIEAMHEI